MTTAGDIAGLRHDPSLPGPRRMPAWAWLSIIAVGLAVISAIRLWSGASNLTSAGAVEAAIEAAVPIALTGLSGLWSERAGIINIGLEGMMILGTFGAGFAGYQWGPWAGLFFGIFCGVLGGLLHGLATITFGVDHIISGVAINIVAPGVTLFLSELLFTNAPGGGQRQSPPVDDVFHITIPGLTDWMASLANKDWFFVSDLAGIIGGVTTQLSALSLLTAIIFVASAFVLWRTRFGLRLRSCGEAPYAAESLGVNVVRYKYAAVAISGGLAGMGGAFLAIGLKFQDGQTRGLGFIGLASMIFGNWRPAGLAMGAGLFGYTDGVRKYDSTDTAMHAVLILMAIGLAVVAYLQWRRGNKAVAAAGLIIAGLAAWWYFSVDEVERHLVSAAPYMITLVVMGLASQRLRVPKANGQPYRKGGVE